MFSTAQFEQSVDVKTSELLSTVKRVSSVRTKASIFIIPRTERKPKSVIFDKQMYYVGDSSPEQLFSAWDYTFAKLKADILTKSGLFNLVAVEDRYFPEPPPPSPDVLIWENTDGWMLRAGAGPVRALKNPGSANDLANDPDKWIGIVREAVILINNGQPAESAETTRSPTQQALAVSAAKDQTTPKANAVAPLPMKCKVGGITYDSLDAARRGARERAEKEVAKILPIGKKQYQSAVIIFKTNKEYEERTIGTQSEIFMPIMELSNDIANEAIASALVKSQLFLNFTIIHADDGETRDFHGSQYKIWLSKNGWVVADKTGGRQTFSLVPAGPGEPWELPNLNRTVSNVKTALEALSK